MPKPLVILLSGWARSGKDSAAELLVEEMSFSRLAFADMLKEEVSAAMQIPMNVFRENTLKDLYMGKFQATPRQLLVRHAAEKKRKDPNVYSRAIVERIRQSGGTRVVISDWRYRHEYDFLKQELDAHLVRGRILRSSVLPGDDPSEHDLDDESMDFVLANDGSISDLRESIKAIVRTFRDVRK